MLISQVRKHLSQPLKHARSYRHGYGHAFLEYLNILLSDFQISVNVAFPSSLWRVETSVKRRFSLFPMASRDFRQSLEKTVRCFFDFFDLLITNMIFSWIFLDFSDKVYLTFRGVNHSKKSRPSNQLIWLIWLSRYRSRFAFFQSFDH